MLEIKPVCENCGKSLPNDSSEAMICTFECTYCENCVNELLFNVCPNCGGGFEKRPIRPSRLLGKNPVGTKEHIVPVNKDKFKIMLAKYKDIEPDKR